MKPIRILKLLFVLLLTVSFSGFAQNKPFWNEIQAFQKKDSIAMPAKNGIVFTGSSSIRMWKDLETMYKDEQVINRGFGGSVLPQVNDYVQDLVIKYKPRQVVIYCGDNDIAAGASAEKTLENFTTLFRSIRKALPKTNIAFISMKLSPSRAKFVPDVLKANALIKEFITKQKNAHFIDIASKMLDDKGEMRPELFQNDMLHMKPAGYEIWAREITPYLKKK